MSSSQHLNHGLLRSSIRDAGQAQDQIVYAPAMVDQDGDPAQRHPGGIAHKEHIVPEIAAYVIRKRWLGLGLAHNIMIAGRYDHLYVLSDAV